MAYTIYQTDVVILGVREIQEHDLLVRVFSSVFGYMRIVAKGTRRATSKLRAHIQEYSLARIAVVKGKEMFRLTDASHTFSFVQSKSVVNFLRYAETLFFDDENEHGTQVNIDMYDMILRISKFLVYLAHRDTDSDTLVYAKLAKHFFTVYVRGLQGFLHKTNIEGVRDMTDESFLEYLNSQRNHIQEMLRLEEQRVR